MPTPAQIDEQINHERDAIAQGLKRLKENTRNLEDKEYASASIYGVTTIDALLPLVVNRIKETNLTIHKGHTGQSFKEIKQYLADIEPLAAAAITCKITIDKVFSHKQGSNQIQNVCDAIGQGVENECKIRHYERHAPGLLETLKKNYWHKSIGTDQKIVVIQTLMNRYEVQQWKAWGRTNRVKLGGWLLSCVINTSKWFDEEKRWIGRKTETYLVPTPEFIAVKDEVMYNAELFSPLAWPMLVEPNDWSPERPGGYLLNEVMKGHHMIRRSEVSRIQGERPYEFLNKIQKVAYTLNPFIVGVAEKLEKDGTTVGKFQPICHHDLPNKPVDIAENEIARKKYCRDAAEVLNKQAQEFRKSCRTRMTMDTVERFKNKEKFYIPWSFDYRGRVYPIPAFLTPQDTDFGKSLIRFADESFMDDEAEKWLRFQLATTFGLDKETINERLAWTYENEWLVEEIATDPIGQRHEWENVEEPWQFLAACDEFYHCVIKRDRISTGLPVAIDATCSGLQILAGLAKDKSTAQLVNVLPSDKPQDAYKVIAETSKSNIPERLRPNWDRKKTKRTVMTIPYNAKPFSNRSYIRDALKEDGIEIEKEELTQTVNAVRDAMNVIVPGPMRVMKWIESEVSNAIKRGVKELEWVTPSGFIVSQRIFKKEFEEVKLRVLGTARMRIKIATGDSAEVDKARHKAATAPNLIHSLDASLLCLSALDFNHPIALIHDSVLCRATDMSELSRIVREKYMHLFAEHDYLTDFAKQIGAETEPPIIGDLKPESVIESTYFFC
jgi:DNA-directed RNA polymerase